MDNVERDYELMGKGISALLGKAEYDPPEIAPQQCVHVSDGFIYDDTPVFVTLQCTKCGIQYDMSKITGLIL